jgi:transcriptional regulator with XRE-family HTH domain
MISLSNQLRNWRSRYRLSRQEAATALGLTLRTLDDLERGVEGLRGREREELIAKLSRAPGAGIRGPDAGYRPGES